MPATGRRELDEGYKPLAFEELAAVYRVLRSLEQRAAEGGILLPRGAILSLAMLQDLDRVRSALTRIKFITPGEQS